MKVTRFESEVPLQMCLVCLQHRGDTLGLRLACSVELSCWVRFRCFYCARCAQPDPASSTARHVSIALGTCSYASGASKVKVGRSY